MTVFVLWDPKQKAKGIATVSIYDLDNKLLTPSGKTNDVKVNLRPGQQLSTYWQMGVSGLPVGVYRIEVRLNDLTVWRSFFRIVD